MKAPKYNPLAELEIGEIFPHPSPKAAKPDWSHPSKIPPWRLSVEGASMAAPLSVVLLAALFRPVARPSHHVWFGSRPSLGSTDPHTHPVHVRVFWVGKDWLVRFLWGCQTCQALWTSRNGGSKTWKIDSSTTSCSCPFCLAGYHPSHHQKSRDSSTNPGIEGLPHHMAKATYPKRIFFKIKHPGDHVFPGIVSLFFCSIIRWFLPQLSSQDSKKLLASDQIFQPRPSIHGLKHLETQTETAPPPTRKWVDEKWGFGHHPK